MIDYTGCDNQTNAASDEIPICLGQGHIGGLEGAGARCGVAAAMMGMGHGDEMLGGGVVGEKEIRGELSSSREAV